MMCSKSSFSVTKKTLKQKMTVQIIQWEKTSVYWEWLCEIIKFGSDVLVKNAWHTKESVFVANTFPCTQTPVFTAESGQL